MSRKKQVISAFGCFMNDYEKAGKKRFPNKQQLVEEAGPHWEKLAKEQKQHYRQLAQSLKNSSTKFSSDGQNMDFVQESDNRRKLKEQNMKENITELMSFLKESNQLQNQNFHIVSVNYYCHENKSRKFIPAEIAIVRFNLEDGVTDNNVFHYIIKPGKLPLGYAADATIASQKSHQLPVPLNIDNAEDNREEVKENLFKFLRVDMKSNEKDLPVLYCNSKEMSKVENIMAQLLGDYGYDEDSLKIYSLQLLLFRLRNAVLEGDSIVWQSISCSESEFEIDEFDFTKGIACDYHDESDALMFCTRSIVIRSAYMICKNCCPDLELSLKPGFHIPKTAKFVEQKPVKKGTSSVYSEDRYTKPSDIKSTETESLISDFTSCVGLEEPGTSETDFHFSQSTDWFQVKSKKRNQATSSRNGGPALVTPLTQEALNSFNSISGTSPNNFQAEPGPSNQYEAGSRKSFGRGRGRNVFTKMNPNN